MKIRLFLFSCALLVGTRFVKASADDDPLSVSGLCSLSLRDGTFIIGTDKVKGELRAQLETFLRDIPPLKLTELEEQLFVFPNFFKGKRLRVIVSSMQESPVFLFDSNHFVLLLPRTAIAVPGMGEDPRQFSVRDQTFIGVATRDKLLGKGIQTLGDFERISLEGLYQMSADWGMNAFALERIRFGLLNKGIEMHFKIEGLSGVDLDRVLDTAFAIQLEMPPKLSATLREKRKVFTLRDVVNADPVIFRGAPSSYEVFVRIAHQIESLGIKLSDSWQKERIRVMSQRL